MANDMVEMYRCDPRLNDCAQTGFPHNHGSFCTSECTTCGGGATTTSEIRTTSSTGGQKGVKPERYSLLPKPALDALARQYAFGAGKYDNHNWRNGYEWSKSYDALMRHATAFWDGEDLDPESGESHMAAVAFHAFSLLTFAVEHPEFDDRRTTEMRRAAGMTIAEINKQLFIREAQRPLDADKETHDG